MNINETEKLKGNIETTSSLNAQQIAPIEGATFQDELNKLTEKKIELGMVDFSQFIALGQTSFSGFQYSPNMTDSLVNETLNVGETYKYDTKKIENVDAMFFLNAASNNGTINIKMKDETSVIDATNYKTMEVSKTLGDLITKSMETNKSVRLDFDDHVTVILKVAKDGRIDTTFIPQDKQVEQYLKNNIDYLKVRFDEQNIAYSNISYKPYRQQRNNKQGDKQWMTLM